MLAESSLSSFVAKSYGRFTELLKIYGIIAAVHPWFAYDSPRFADHCSSFAYDSGGSLHMCIFSVIQLCRPRFEQVKHFDQVKTSARFTMLNEVRSG